VRRCIACLSLLAALLLAPSLASAARVHPRIVAGKDTAIEQVPFQVALYDPQVLDPEAEDDVLDAQFCGGVIRDATHVLTAAHCVTFGGFEAAAPDEIEVLAGTNDLEEPGVGAIRDPVVATSFDPEWNPFSGEHDIGVLTLGKRLWPEGETPEIDGKSTIAPIGFAETAVVAGEEATVSGWGFTKALTAEQEPTEAEEQEGHPSVLQSATVSIVSPAECAEDYEAESPGPFDEAFICAIGKELPTADACLGDSGGPLFSGTPGSSEDRLLALVDFGTGCAQKEFPGVYQSMLEANNRAFAGSNPPQAPRNQSAPTIAGTPQVGQTVSCNPGSWLGAPEFLYRYFRDESTILHPFASKDLTPKFSSAATYAIQSSDAGTRVFCAVIAHNSGGVGEAISEDVSVSAAPQPPAGPATPIAAVVKPAAVPSPPTLRVVSSRCRGTSCSVNVHASRGAGAALVTAVDAKLTFTRKVSCRKHGKRASCKRTFKRKLAARATPGGHFVILATGLKPGPYTLTLVAIDKAGIRQVRATKVSLLVKPVRRKRR
jgi:secreted trypsin-like serine protease